MESDETMVERVLDGDVRAFEVLVRRYERAVRARAWMILRDPHLVDEAAQQTFVTAFERLASLRKRAAFPAWLLRIAYREALAMAREKRRTLPIEAQNSAAPVEAKVSDGGQVLLAAVARLPRQEQAVIMAHYFDGHSVCDVAAMLGCPVGTVTKQLQRARDRLRKRLRRDEL